MLQGEKRAGTTTISKLANKAFNFLSVIFAWIETLSIKQK